MNNSQIRIGPSGIGPTKDIISNLEKYSKLGITAAEVTFTYSIYINKENAIIIGKKAKELNIKLSIHAPYFINLNSQEKEKVEASKNRIIKCCEIGHLMGVEQIVFHSGFYSKEDKLKTYENIKKCIIEIQNLIKKNEWNVKLSPEIMGKVNVFGSIEEISKLAKETGCSFTIDFAHILARYKKDMFDEVLTSFPQKEWHCHFSGIEYNEKGERKHLNTEMKDWKDLIDKIKSIDKTITIINESPNPIEDALMGLKMIE